MTIKPDIRTKVIEMAREGKGRNEIAHEMRLSLSSGSVSNILKEWKEGNPASASVIMDNKTSPSCSQSLEVPLKPESSNDHLSVVRHSSLNREQPDLNKSRGEEEFKTNPDILIKNTEENGLLKIVKVKKVFPKAR